MTAAVLTILIAPLLWCGLAFGLRRLLMRDEGVPDDAGEKRYLAILLAPAVLGVALAIAARFVPIHLPAHISGMAVPPPIPVAPLVPSHTAQPTHVMPAIDLMKWLIPIVLAVYVVGFVMRALPLVLAFGRLKRVVNLARLSEVAGEAIYLTASDMPPLAWGRDIILLPESLAKSLSRDKLGMLIRHEREHLHRGDPNWFACLAWIDAMFWFNPFVRLQTGRCRTAAELACDAAVTRAAPAMREVYASLLVEALKHAAGDVRQYAPAVISTCKSGDYRMRLTEIMHAEPAARKPKPWLYVALATAAIPLAMAQFAWSQPASAPAEEMATRAPTDGVVSRVYVDPSAKSFGPEGEYKGKLFTVEIDYGLGLKSSHLLKEPVNFKVGDHITKGQLIEADAYSPNLTIDIGDPSTGASNGKSCIENRSCELTSSYMTSGKDGQVIASDMAELRIGQRVIHADLIYTWPDQKLAIAHGHVSIDDKGRALEGR